MNIFDAALKVLEGCGCLIVIPKQQETTFHRISMVTTENLFSCFQSNQLQLTVMVGLIRGAKQFCFLLNCISAA